MDKVRVRSASQLRYYPNDKVSVCALCGGDPGTVCFKGKLVCEDCINIVKGLY